MLCVFATSADERAQILNTIQQEGSNVHRSLFAAKGQRRWALATGSSGGAASLLADKNKKTWMVIPVKSRDDNICGGFCSRSIPGLSTWAAASPAGVGTPVAAGAGSRPAAGARRRPEAEGHRPCLPGAVQRRQSTAGKKRWSGRARKLESCRQQSPRHLPAACPALPCPAQAPLLTPGGCSCGG